MDKILFFYNKIYFLEYLLTDGNFWYIRDTNLYAML